MSGTVIRIGRYRASNGPDLAIVYGNQQTASHTNPKSPANGVPLIAYSMGAWVGRYSGAATGRLAIMGTDGSNNIRNPIRRTVEFSPTANYMDAAGGQLITANLESPVALTWDEVYAVAAVARNGDLGIAMIQASAISETDETFWRKDTSGTTFVDAIGSARSNEGQLMIHVNAEQNIKPNLPTGLSPSGSNLLISTKPTLTANFSDPNEVLNNGAAYDKLTSTKVTVRTGSATGTIVWQSTYNNSASEQAAKRSSVVCGVTLSYGVTYYYTVEHKDIGGLWSSVASTSFSIKSPNAEPYAPDQLAPSGSISNNDLTPVLSFRHRDPDGNSASNAQVVVQRVSNSAQMWNKTWPTSVANNGTTSIVYAGLTLAYNEAYRFQARTQDSAGAWGDWSAWTTFTVTSLSAVEAPSSPVGYQASQTPANIVAKYTHGSGVAANAFKVQLQNENGGVLGTTGWISKSVASGANVTLTWAETGFNNRSWGDKLKIAVKARDTNGVESPSWSPAVAFNINAAPSIPSGLTPNGPAYSTRPLLIVTNVTDADTTQNPKSSLVVKAILTTNAGTFTRTMTWNSTKSRWEYQTTATDLPTQSSFVNTWQAYSYDGIVYSGEKTVEADAGKSSIATFVYDAVPTVAITAPTGTIENSQPIVTWTSSAPQASYRVYGYMGGVLVYDSGVVTSSTLSHTIDPTKFLDGERWNTGETLTLEVRSTNTTALTGTSAQVDVLLLYTPPNPLPLTGQGMSLPETVQTNAMELWHEPTDVANENFEGYVWRRIALTDDLSTVEGSEVTLAVVKNAAVTRLIDASVASRQVYRWSVTVRERRGNDIVESTPETFEGRVTWDGIVIHIPADPLNTAVELAWSTGGANYTADYEWSRQTAEHEALTGDSLFTLGKKLKKGASGTFELMDDEAATAEERLATLHHVYLTQGGEIDGTPHVACWRSGRGGVNGILYGMLEANPSITYDEGGLYELSIGIREAKYTLGVEVDQ